ncbi:MAG: sugar kinase [Paracoccaceae bacterium]|nr:sugar kinase [Paracoccaceae bacterium]
MKRLLAIGECMIELAPDAAGKFDMGFAGDTFNTAWYARRLAGDQISVGYLSAVGDDEPSHRMTAFMEDAGIKPHLAKRVGRSVGLYMISLKNGERSFSYWRDSSAARTLADDLTVLPDLQAGDVAYFSGITLAVLPAAGRRTLLDVLSKARGDGIQIAFDPNLRPRLWSDSQTMCDWIMQAASVSDIALPSFEDEQTFFGDTNPAKTADRYSAAGVTTVIVKDGPRDVLIRYAGREELVPNDPARTVIDTTAAGDSFNAGYLVAKLQEHPDASAVAEGCAVARKVIAARGALVEV